MTLRSLISLGRWFAATACTLGVLAQSAFAAMPAGDYDLDFKGPVQLWDISGTYSEDIDDVTTDYTINMDSRGRITGAGVGSYDDGVDSFNAAITLGGSVTSAGTVTRVRLKLRLEGPAHVSGYDGIIVANFNYNLEIDSTQLDMVGSLGGSVSISVPGLGRVSQRVPLTLVGQDILPGMDGTWSVHLEDVTTVANKLAGSGLVSLSNGRDIPFAVTGSYAGRTDQSRFILKGTGMDLGANLNLTADSTGTGLLLRTFRGRMLGQTVKPPPPVP